MGGVKDLEGWGVAPRGRGVPSPLGEGAVPPSQ